MASKALTLYRLSPDGAVIGRPDASPIPWERLPRPDLMRAFAASRAQDRGAFPAGKPLSFSVPETVAMLRSYWHETRAAVDVNVTGGTLPPPPLTAPVVPSVAVTSPDPAPVPVVTSPVVPSVDPSTVGNGADVLAALGAFVSSLAASSVDETTVRAIVADALAALPVPSSSTCQHVTTTIHVNGSPDPSATINGPVHHRFPRLLDVMAAGRSAYLFGPPGTGKSHAAIAAADALGLPFVGIVACSPDMMPSALRGFIDASGTYQRTAFRDAFENGGVFVVDEADNAPPAITVGLLNTALASGFLTFPDGTVRKSPEFRAVVTANTNGTGPTAAFSGRFPLDPSTLDRFQRLAWGYDATVDRAIVAATGAAPTIVDGVMAAVVRMRDNIDAAGLRGFVTPRGAESAALFLSRGWSWDDVLESCLIPAGFDDAQRRTLLAGVSAVSV